MAEESLHIPKDLLEQFKNGSQGSGAGADPGADPGRTVSNEMAIQSLEKSLDWIIKTIDTTAKEHELPGIGKMNPGELSELLSICIERNVNSEYLQKSPEIMAVTILSGIGLQNYMAMKKKPAKPAKTDPESDD